MGERTKVGGGVHADFNLTGPSGPRAGPGNPALKGVLRREAGFSWRLALGFGW